MTKSELIALISGKQPHLQLKDVELAINGIVQTMTETLASGNRIEVRGFGSFESLSREPRIGRNPKTGESVSITNKRAIHFKPGLEMRHSVNASRLQYKIRDL